MLDQNTDRMWFVIGAVIVGAAIIFIANGTLPDIFASVTSTFEQALDNSDVDNMFDLQLDISHTNIKDDGTLDIIVKANSGYRIQDIEMVDAPVEGRNLAIVSDITRFIGGHLYEKNTNLRAYGSKMDVIGEPNHLIGFEIYNEGKNLTIHGESDSEVITPWRRHYYYDGSTTYPGKYASVKPDSNGRFEINMNIPNNVRYVNFGIGRHYYVEPYYVDKLKIEIGDSPTPYTPAPEDVRIVGNTKTYPVVSNGTYVFKVVDMSGEELQESITIDKF